MTESKMFSTKVSTWYDAAFPGVHEFGAVVTWYTIIATVFVFFGQGIYAESKFWQLKGQISKLYGALISINIWAMAAVFTPLLLNGVTPVPPFHGEGQETDYSAAFPAVYVEHFIIFFFPLCAVANLVRIVYDAGGAKGYEQAWKMIPVAWFSQAWVHVLLVIGTVDFGMAILLVIILDYVQHLAGLVYWCTSGKSAQPRESSCIQGAIFHMLGMAPIFAYRGCVYGGQVEHNHLKHIALMTFTVLTIAYSQMCFIKVAELTPKETLDVRDIQGSDAEKLMNK